MTDDVFDAKLKHIGDSIDKVREEGRLRGERQEKDTAEIKDKLDDLATTSARHDERIKVVETGVKFNRELIWKILAILATTGAVVEKIFN